MATELPRSAASLAAIYHGNAALRTLLEAGARANARDSIGATALHWAALSNNGEGVRLLCSAGGDGTLCCFPSMTALQVGCACASVEAMRVLMSQPTTANLRFCLHFSVIFPGGYAGTIGFLVAE